jgi:outer membrane protein OmpA-like peptidoglycan-associated protein
MRFLRCAAILFFSAALTAGAANCADTTKADDKKPAAASGDAAKTAVTTGATAAADPAVTDTAAATPTDAAAATEAAPATDATTTPALSRAPVNTALAAASGGGNSSPSESPAFTPMPALDGNPGLFTLETGETLPKHGFSLGIGLNKFSRMPGEVTSLQLIPALGYGVTRWFSLFFNIDAQDHLHVGAPSQLSLSSVNALNPQYQNTIYNSVIPSTGFRPGYVEDIPFASRTGTGVGEIDLGFKIGLLSERRGKPLSLSIRNDFYLPTVTGFNSLLSNQVQYGKFNYGIGVEASKTIFHHSITATANWAYRFTRDSTYNNANIDGVPGPAVLNLADQMQIGAGMLIFPDKRFQIITEYNSTIYVGSGIKNTTAGPRDPVDSITGIRLYAWKWAALDLGYRYSLDLTGHRDRNGFVIKVGTAFWPEKPLPPDSITSSCAVDKSSVLEGSNEAVVATATATDLNGRPLTYVWTATGGKISGVGQFVRWDSSGVGPGGYVLTARVENGAGNNSSCSANVTVRPKPAAPTMSCTANPSTVLAGERATITASVNDPSGSALTYAWQTNGGQIVGDGASVQLDTSGLQPGNYVVTGRAENVTRAACDCSANVTVQTPAPAPQASKVSACNFTLSSARADNVCKRNLDDVAVRLQSDPKSKVVLVGYADPKEPRAGDLATRRGDAGKKYLGDEKGVDAARVEVRTAAGSEGAGDDNRRLDIIFVPDGASY